MRVASCATRAGAGLALRAALGLATLAALGLATRAALGLATRAGAGLATLGGAGLAMLAGSPLAAQQPPEDADRAFVQVTADPPVVFEQQAFRLVLRFGVEERFLREQVIQPFRQQLDVPVRVDAGWAGALPDAAPVGATPDRGPSFVLDGELAHARRVDAELRDGRRFQVFELERAFRPERPGVRTLAPAALRIAFATRFRDDFVAGRVPEDRHDLTAVAEPCVVRVEPLPVVGRPAGFGGAVGRFTVRAELDRREVDVGDPVRLTLTIAGDGNLATFEPPAFAAGESFHVLGRLDEAGPDGRLVVYDLAPLHADVAEVPAVALSFFDPTPPAGYRTVSTEPIAITVRGAGAAPSERDPPELRSATVAGVDDIHGLLVVGATGPEAHAHPGGPGTWAWLLAPWCAALGVVGWRSFERARRARRGDGRREAFLAGAARGEVGAAFVEYLAGRLGCAPPAVVAPDLARRLRAAAVPEPCVAATVAVVGAIVDARHGGTVDRRWLDAEARRQVDALERCARVPEAAA